MYVPSFTGGKLNALHYGGQIVYRTCALRSKAASCIIVLVLIAGGCSAALAICVRYASAAWVEGLNVLNACSAKLGFNSQITWRPKTPDRPRYKALYLHWRCWEQIDLLEYKQSDLWASHYWVKCISINSDVILLVVSLAESLGIYRSVPVYCLRLGLAKNGLQLHKAMRPQKDLSAWLPHSKVVQRQTASNKRWLGLLWWSMDQADTISRWHNSSGTDLEFHEIHSELGEICLYFQSLCNCHPSRSQTESIWKRCV